MQGLPAIEAEKSKLALLFESPVQMLIRIGLAAPSEAGATSSCATLGCADWGRYKGDRLLAAAVLSRLDTLPATSRPFKIP